MADYTKTYAIDYSPSGDTVYSAVQKLEEDIDDMIAWLSDVKDSYASASAPVSPAPSEGQIWYDSTNNIAYAYDGTNWRVLGTVVKTTAPSSPQEGDLWYQSTDNALYAYNGSAWKTCGAVVKTSAPTVPTAAEGNQWWDSTNDVMAVYNGTEWFKGGVTVDPLGDGADHGWSGNTALLTAGEDLVFSDACYMKSDGKLWKADADATSTMPIMAMALATIAADASGRVLLDGFVRDDTWTWTVGGKIYASTTGGALTQTAPSGADDQVQCVGIATHADRVWFNPDVFAETVGNYAQFYSGTYTGDGSEDQGITGVGFQPEFVWVFIHRVDSVSTFLMTDQDTTYTYSIYSRAWALNQIISLDADGFSVDDAGSDAHPNKDTQVYDFICLAA